ncbi:pre-miRNA 5'-monophosphate methyltransferase-like [Centruroides sculpturatus]|uniref:pre-miRNA 5'-monophosphate methyltransferase-like n=1 Tax=Centruroides sculpturatus TaxID=218467 RepID=UPI000C6D99EF|nr:pre-miRNA 5'-monophosphate methyltransferase-like [Centruroides sculpturatus]
MSATSGSAQFGNFNNYYQFNPVENRLKLLPINILDLFQNEVDVLMLDIGCNAGDLTIGFYEHFSQKWNVGKRKLHIFAFDLDSSLIDKCKELNPYPENIHYFSLNIMEESAYKILKQFLSKFNKEKFDMTLCFSVTMWIHLNYGDCGLKTFLKNTCNLTNYLLLEPQNWKCYRSTSRRMRRLKCDKFQNLEDSVTKTMVENIENFLNSNCEVEKVKTFGITKWKRCILLYKNSDVSEISIEWKII